MCEIPVGMACPRSKCEVNVELMEAALTILTRFKFRDTCAAAQPKLSMAKYPSGPAANLVAQRGNGAGLLDTNVENAKVVRWTERLRRTAPATGHNH